MDPKDDLQAAEIEAMRTQLGLPNAPLVIEGLRTARLFFHQKLHYSPLAWLSYLRGIDFHHPVRSITLQAPDEVLRHKPENGSLKPFLYFAWPGVSPMRTGTNFPKVTFERYGFLRPVPALESIASSIAFSPTRRIVQPGESPRLVADRVVRPGGATQLIIPATDFSALVRR